MRRIFEVKGRPSTSPLIVHVDSAEMAQAMVVSAWPAQADILARNFWPGPLSLVLPKQKAVPNEVTAGLPTVGVRAPSHPVAIELIREAALPLAAPSANRFMHLSPTEAQHVRLGLGSAVDWYSMAARPPSVSNPQCSRLRDTPMLLRPGMISREDIERYIGPVAMAAGSSNHEGGDAAPGMREKHYSPTTPLLLTAEPPATGRGAFVWWDRNVPTIARSVRLPSEPAAYAREIYSVLHALDQEGLDFIAGSPCRPRRNGPPFTTGYDAPALDNKENWGWRSRVFQRTDCTPEAQVTSPRISVQLLR